MRLKPYKQLWMRVTTNSNLKCSRFWKDTYCEINMSHLFQEKQEGIKIIKMIKRFFKNHYVELKEPNDDMEIKALPKI